MLTVALFLIAGLVLLIAGAELMVRGASRIAIATGISPLVVGLTVVAIGTSAPELAIGVGASLQGNPDIAIGNVIGSNIANILLILGLSATIAPLVVSRQLVRLDVPIMLSLSVLIYLRALDGVISRWEGALLTCGAIVYTTLLIGASRRASKRVPPDPASAVPDAKHQVQHRSPWLDLLCIPAGLGLLVLGADWLVDGAVEIAKGFGVSELVIGLTVIAVGTSLPEIATTVMAAMRGQRELAVGNVIGSNIFNLMLVLGMSAAVSPHGIPVSEPVIHFDLPVMVAVAVACLPIFFTEHRIARWEGLLFLGYYVAYTLYLLMKASHHAQLDNFAAAMTWFVMPLTAMTLSVLSLRALRQHLARRNNPGTLENN
jgi:cation:H+ antiporter